MPLLCRPANMAQELGEKQCVWRDWQRYSTVSLCSVWCCIYENGQVSKLEFCYPASDDKFYENSLCLTYITTQQPTYNRLWPYPSGQYAFSLWHLWRVLKQQKVYRFYYAFIYFGYLRIPSKQINAELRAINAVPAYEWLITPHPPPLFQELTSSCSNLQVWEDLPPFSYITTFQ